MSEPPRTIRRADLAIDDARARQWLSLGQAGRLGTVSADGWPYVVPMLYVHEGETVFLHGSRARGHLRSNLERDPRACFVVDVPGSVYGYGRFECDTSLSYGSVMVFGRVRVVEDELQRIAFCDALMAKYGGALSGRPAGFYPRLDHISIYALDIERLTGKEIVLPAASQSWPAVDRTKSPDAVPPDHSGDPA